MSIKFNEDGSLGLTVTFDNGATASCQSTPNHYCTPGESVEVHAWGPNGERVNLRRNKDLVGWVRPDSLFKLLLKVAQWKPPLEWFPEVVDKAARKGVAHGSNLR